MRAPALLVIAAAASGCVSTAHLSRVEVGGPTFDPAAFFAGETEGRGRLKVAFRRAEPTLVEGHGRILGDGDIVLEQSVRRGSDAPTTRIWRLHRRGPGGYVGTLSDASGPVTGEVAGNRLHLAFAMKGGLQAQQWLYLEPGGEVARNVMVVRKFGLPLARLDETITRRRR